MSWLGKKPEVKEIEGVVRRAGLVSSCQPDVGPDYWAVMLEGNSEPIQFRARDSVALALTKEGDKVRIKLKTYQALRIDTVLVRFHNLTLNIRDEKEFDF